MNIIFPPKVTESGDLALAKTTQEDALSRAEVLTRVSRGEKPGSPLYGRPIHLYQPAFGHRIQAGELQKALNDFAVYQGDLYFTVEPAPGSSDNRPILAVKWTHQTNQIQGGFNVGS